MPLQPPLVTPATRPSSAPPKAALLWRIVSWQARASKHPGSPNRHPSVELRAWDCEHLQEARGVEEARGDMHIAHVACADPGQLQRTKTRCSAAFHSAEVL
jgi:hypothetical protein